MSGQDELFWDYQPAVSVIKQYISSRILSGWAIKTDSGTLSGYSYYVINEPVAYIGNLYVQSECATAAAYAELLNKILHSLSNGNRIRRIESQIFAFNCDLVPLFEKHEFTAIKRHFLLFPLDQPQEGKDLQIQPNFRVRRVGKQVLFTGSRCDLQQLPGFHRLQALPRLPVPRGVYSIPEQPGQTSRVWHF